MSDDRLWAPWRLEYLTGDAASPTADALPQPTTWQPGADPACFLCRSAAAYDDAEVDRKHHVVARGQHALVMLNLYPYNNGHLLVAPLRHVASLADLTSGDHLDCMEWLTRLTGILTDKLKADGFNIGLNLSRAAGAGCPGHLHWHIVPRWLGDSNFMPVVAGTRVIPQSLDALWQVLVGALDNDDSNDRAEKQT